VGSTPSGELCHYAPVVFHQDRIDMTRCSECNGLLRAKIKVSLDVPMKYFQRLTKKAIRERGVEIESADWEVYTTYCPDCGWTCRFVRSSDLMEISK